ncbi:MAG: hypothetical protein R3B82_01475 [Sandaracinaceae bacterium]
MNHVERRQQGLLHKRKETIALTALAVGLLGVSSPLLYANYERVRLLLWGDDATGTIVEVRDTGRHYREHPELEVTLELQRASGETYEVTVERAVPATQRARYEVGAEVDVQVDPSDDTTVRIARVHPEDPAQVAQRAARQRARAAARGRRQRVRRAGPPKTARPHLRHVPS